MRVSSQHYTACVRTLPKYVVCKLCNQKPKNFVRSGSSVRCGVVIRLAVGNGHPYTPLLAESILCAP